MSTHYYSTFTTAFGDFSVAVDQAGAVVGTAFGDETALRSRLGKCHLMGDTSATRQVREQVLAYFSGERRTFDLPLAPAGTAFQQKVWATLQRIPFGETRTYGGLAEKLGNASASRAVGRANATNPICLIVPCHRVIGADGSLTGFAFGEDIKRRLLEHEGALTAA
ncbi:MAG: methylated-DNA--[protein]-cysteine S-methyltransferase [Verrucomicrobia bacterium]|nr:methylated-DNA--[protein]-cysteine S-methyltransferase [Verrucomicrobiota bacterium]